ncbi:cytochrome P450 [Dendrothele bispora CBS 962.96]|uniref:Cytochrome P450 n=1 Tax=Dendrothele bispora (strain CBS 962.96) TaxID=1314807 RepID=A0A4S8L0A0_DENBC|nr:cytochrome P450 [Dendrothele bispora CBS 962.96]
MISFIHPNFSWKEDFVFMPYGNSWRECRKLFHQELNPSDPTSYEPNVLRSSRLLLKNILKAPEDWRFCSVAGTLILSITYGINAKPSLDPFIQAAEVALNSVTESARPGAFLVDQFPWLQYIPAWFPGASFKRKAREWRMYRERMANGPFNVVMKQIVRCIASFCFRNREGQVHEQCGSIYSSGTSTTLAAFSTFILAMVCNPQYQHKAQQELDQVLGKVALPELKDKASLPYITAIMKEVQRWQPVGPLGVPHFLEKEDVYNGFRIPKNTIIVPNVWAMLHNEAVYGPEPDKFNPERFLTKDGILNSDIPDPDFDFGFGRRICPGRHVGLASLWISMASVLATFNLEKARDGNGRVLEPSGEYIPSSIQNHPAPFDCLITPRSKEHEQLIQESL